MATITIRLMSSLNEDLNRLSEETGILKSSLILYAINENLRLRINPDIGEIHPSANLVRMTLRIPDNLKSLLEAYAKSKNVSANTLVNNFVYIQSGVIWDSYKPISKVLKELTAKSELPTSPAPRKGRNINRPEAE